MSDFGNGHGSGGKAERKDQPSRAHVIRFRGAWPYRIVHEGDDHVGIVVRKISGIVLSQEMARISPLEIGLLAVESPDDVAVNV